MYSSQDLALLPVPHDSVIASFDLCNYQQLPVLDNICFGLEDGDRDELYKIGLPGKSILKRLQGGPSGRGQAIVDIGISIAL